MYPHWLMTKENRKKNRESLLDSYKSGKRKPNFKGEKRPNHSIIMKKKYNDGDLTPIYMVGKNNPTWKGDEARYSAIHTWLRNHRKKDGICDFCDKEPVTRTEFANISGKYKRDINDYLELCPSCHRLLDYKSYDKLSVSITYLKELGFL